MIAKNMAQSLRGSLSAMIGKSTDFLRDGAGTVAVEFSFILPIMVTIWLGGVEITHALSVDRKVVTLTAAVGDITARSKKITESQVNSLFGLTEAAMFPEAVDDTTIIVTAVDIDADGNAAVGWSRASNTTAYVTGAPMDTDAVPAAYRTPNSQIIMAEVHHPHLPKIGYRITETIDFDEKMFFTPRLSTYVQLCDNSGNNCVQ
jgi:Flp pilus assembly protein TadG